MRATLIGIAAVFLFVFNSPSFAGAENTAGGIGVVASAQAPVTKGATSLSLDVSQNAQNGQVAIADVLTYGGPRPTITPPDGWELIRDDFTSTTRQSLYWHAI